MNGLSLNLPFDLREELAKLRQLELIALKADNAVLRQRLKIFPPVEQAVEAALNGSSLKDITNRIIVKAVKEHGHSQAARTLNVGRSTIYKRLKDMNGSAAKLLSLLVFVFLLGGVAIAQSVKIAWDASPSSTNQPIGYRLYANTNGFGETNKVTVPVRLNAGTNLTATITNALPGTWHVRATAYNLSNSLESVLSDPLIFSVPIYSPENLRTVALQWNATVDGTNWIDTGFFRIKFGP